jgi:hypothetical protein
VEGTLEPNPKYETGLERKWLQTAERKMRGRYREGFLLETAGEIVSYLFP